MNRKIFLTYTGQIDKLKNEKALIINDIPYAASVLKKLSYFSLIGGYKAPFRASAAQKFIRGVTFEEIFAILPFL